MKASERRLDGITVVDVIGSLGAEDRGRLKDTVAKLVLRGERHIVFNLRGLTHVDSAGLGELVACYTRATRDEAATIKLVTTDRQIRDLLAMTRLLPLFHVYDSDGDAVGSIPAAA